MNHNQNTAIANFANVSGNLTKAATGSQEYKAIVAQMEELDLVIMVEHCHLCHLHSTTLRHNAEEYRDKANSYISVLLETARDAGIYARIGVARYGTSVSAMGPPPLSASASQDKEYKASVGDEKHSEDRYKEDQDHEIPSPSSQASSPGPIGHGDDENPYRVTTQAGQDLENAGKPLGDLSPNLRGFVPQQRQHPLELRNNTKRLKHSSRKGAHSHFPKAKCCPVNEVEPDTGASEQEDEPSRRLGALEIMVLFRPRASSCGHGAESEGDEGPSENQQCDLRGIKTDILHSKLASQKWPSRSVLARRFNAFIGRYNVPGVTNTASSPDDGKAAANITLAEYPDFHAGGSTGAMRVSSPL